MKNPACFLRISLLAAAALLSACGGGGGGNGGEEEGAFDIDYTPKYVGTWKSDCFDLDIESIAIHYEGATENYQRGLVSIKETLELKRVGINEMRGKRRLDIYQNNFEKCEGPLLGSLIWDDDKREEFTSKEGVARSGAGLALSIYEQVELKGEGEEKVNQVIIDMEELTPFDEKYTLGNLKYSPWHIAKIWHSHDIMYINEDKMMFGDIFSVTANSVFPKKLNFKHVYTKQ